MTRRLTGLAPPFDRPRSSTPERCLHQLISEQAARTPESVAVEGDDRLLTYRELDDRSSRLATYLAELGIGPELRVGFSTERGAEMMVGILGILKTGAAYVPIDPTHPRDRIRTILEDANVAGLVTQAPLLEQLPVDGVRVVCLDQDWPEIEQRPADPLPVDHAPDQLAYVIYTSGSTGTPKGVEIEHRSVVNLMAHMAAEPGLDESDIVANLTTFAFDLSVPDLYLPLIRGARLVVFPREATLDGREVATRLERSKVTFAQATPTTWQMLLNSGWKGSSRLKIAVGGEAVPRSLANALIEHCESVWHMYGPTETTVWSSASRLTTGDGFTPIGGPIANTWFHVLDDRLQAVPDGVAGQLYIGGDGLARGYFNRPLLTAEKFIEDPFRPESGQRLYATGDLVRYRGGHLEFLGRIDHQVKLRGFRIELGEVEATLEAHPSVAAAAVVIREDRPGDPELVGYVSMRGEKPSSSELRRHAEQTLPAYMVPSRILVLDAFPLTPNGKIDRNALPDPATIPQERENDYVAPRTRLEKMLARTWEDVLDIRPIGVTDNFFDLGASSIVAARLFARMEKRLGTKLPLGLIFEAPTIAELGHVMDEGSGGRRWTSLVPIQPEGTASPIFCVHGGAGTILHLAPLGRRFAPERPFYGLQAAGLYGGTSPLTTVEAQAAHYISELRDVQPHGPYYLAGYCYGAIVAYEMAQRLLTEGEEIALVALFNGPSPAYIRSHSPQGSNEPTNAASTVRHKAGRALRQPRHIPGVLLWYGLRLRWKIKDRVAKSYVERGWALPESLRDSYFLVIHHRAERTYAPRPYPGEVLCFYGEGLYGDDPCLGWGDLAATIPFAVPGDHPNNRVAMREPHSGVIAARLQEYLEAETPAYAEPEPIGAVAP